MSQFNSIFGTPLLKAAFALAAAGLSVSLISFATPSFPAEVLSFFYCFSWIVWLGCVVTQPSNNGVRLFCLWVVIDAGILAMFMSVAAANGDVMNAKGTDLIWLITYLPVILPSALISGALAHGLEAIANASTNGLSPTFGSVLYAWLQMSAIGSIQSLLIFVMALQLHRWRQRATGSGVVRKLAQWLALAFFVLVFLAYLNSAVFSIGVADGLSNSSGLGWSRRALGHLSFSLAVLLIGVAIYIGIRQAPNIKKITFVLLVIGLCFMAAPYVGLFILEDQCLDSGGSWSKAAIRCSNE